MNLQAACATGYVVQEGTSPSATTWSTLGTLPANAGSFQVTPTTLGIHYYRVTMNLSDGTTVVSNVIPLQVTKLTPQPPINLQVVFSARFLGLKGV